MKRFLEAIIDTIGAICAAIGMTYSMLIVAGIVMVVILWIKEVWG